ncbi:MAG: DNA-directed DNA polymerase II small subunit [Thermoplasmatota archaeon]
MQGTAGRLAKFNKLLSPDAYEVIRERPDIVDTLVEALESGREMPMFISQSDIMGLEDLKTAKERMNSSKDRSSGNDQGSRTNPSAPADSSINRPVRAEGSLHHDRPARTGGAPSPASRLAAAIPSGIKMDGAIGGPDIFKPIAEVEKAVKGLLDGSPGSRSRTRLINSASPGRRGRPPAAEVDSNVSVIFDPASEMGTRGKIEDFNRMFLDRFRNLRDILRSQYGDLSPTEDIGALGTTPDSVRIIGIIEDIRHTKNGHIMVNIEDPTGNIRFLVNKNRRELTGIQMVQDEVVGVVGKYKPGDQGGSGIVFADQLFKADLPSAHRRRISEDDGLLAAFMSDIHIGSRMFLEKEWNRMIRWLNGEGGGSLSDEMAGRIKYLVVAGDLVDGIGIYPDQDKDLIAPDIDKQYEMLAEAMSHIPDHVTLIMIPGNHDAVRIAEPQPPLPREYQDMFTNSHIHFLSNPSFFKLSGVHVAGYHGKSLDDLVQLFKDVTYEDPIEGMKEMVRFRHFSPSYGMRNQLAPEEKDHLIIKDVPDILVSGHVHRYGYDVYKGIQLIQGGTWQSQTPFQKMMNLKPQPAKMALVELDRANAYHTWEIPSRFT